jgi:prepilin-type N-terminal cleavage/methylation domain-containing protein
MDSLSFRSERGFTLTELVVAMAVIAFVLGGLLTLQLTGQETYLTGSNQVESQESGRIAVQRMIMEIRTAGQDPQGATNVTPPTWTRITNASATAFTIQNDWSGDGVITPGITVNVNGTLHGERVTYSLNGATLQRQESTIDVAPQDVITGVDQLVFAYFAADNTVIANPAANAAAIRTVGVTLRTRPSDQPAATQGRVWVTMNDRVRMRN